MLGIKKFLIVIGVSILATQAFATDLIIFDVRRNITLSENEKAYRDYYISGGNGTKLKKGLVVTAVRKIQMRDSSGSTSYGDILVPVGQIRIIAVFDKISVGREYKTLDREDLPMLEQRGIMSGDSIDFTGSFLDNSFKKHAENSVAPTRSEASVAPENSSTLASASASVPKASSPPPPTPATTTAQQAAPTTTEKETTTEIKASVSAADLPKEISKQ